MFMHYGLLHLALNMWALYQAGHFVEKLQGRTLYTLTYFASGVAGGFASIFWNGDHTWSAGASGAVFGVYGAIFGYLLREKHGLPASLYQSLLKSSLTFAGYNILFGAARAGTDNSAHIGGVLGGMVLGWIVAMPVDRTVRDQESGRRFLMGAGALVAIIVAGVAFTPRFNYNVREQLAWENANKSFFEKQPQLIAANEAALTRLTTSGSDGREHSAWLQSQLVPFYRSWDAQLLALKLTPGRATQQQRDQLEKIVRAQADSYQKLANGLMTNVPEAIAKYIQDREGIGRLVAEFNRE
jgi:rhomboid protease GluP